MYSVVAKLMFWLVMLQTTNSTYQINPMVLLDHYAANADQLRSMCIVYDCSRELIIATDPNMIRIGHHVCDLRCDGEQVFWRQYRWGGVKGTEGFTPQEDAHYLSILWDGQTYSNYRSRKGEEKGFIVFEDNPDVFEINMLQYDNMVSPLQGCYQNSFERVDRVLRQSDSLFLRDEAESVNGVDCYVIEAKTNYGHYTVWIDPEHGYSIAKARVRASSR